MTYTVAWIPFTTEVLPTSEKELLGVGGRVVSNESSQRYTEEVVKCLRIGAPRDGFYISIPMIECLEPSLPINQD